MSLAKLDANFLVKAEKLLAKNGGSATWTDPSQDATYDAFGNIVTPATPPVDYAISLLTIEAKEGWINANLASVTNTIFMVSAKQLTDYGIVFNGDETITFNSKVYSIVRDLPEMGGQVPILHNFVCSVA